jgi:predicted RNase H-like HicB family nuclease
LFLFKGETRARLFAFCPLQLLSIILVFNAPESTQGLIFYWLHNPVFFSAAKSHKLRRVDSREKNAMKIQASFVKDGKWWVAWTDDVPGALTQGATLKEARENLADAVRMIREPIDLSKLPKSKVVIEQLEV